jgi:hypothetical protein
MRDDYLERLLAELGQLEPTPERSRVGTGDETRTIPPPVPFHDSPDGSPGRNRLPGRPLEDLLVPPYCAV